MWDSAFAYGSACGGRSRPLGKQNAALKERADLEPKLVVLPYFTLMDDGGENKS